MGDLYAFDCPACGQTIVECRTAAGGLGVFHAQEGGPWAYDTERGWMTRPGLGHGQFGIHVCEPELPPDPAPTDRLF